MDYLANILCMRIIKFLHDIMTVLQDSGSTDAYPYEKSSNTHDYFGNEYYYAGYAMSEINFSKY